MFLVGCGAVGCELLKNYALIGLGAGKNGKIFTTDDDIIENSNLNRQLLFRKQDIKQPKAEVAAKSVRAINPKMNIQTYVLRLSNESQNTFNDQF